MIVCFGEALVDLFAEPVDTPLDRAERFLPHLGGAPANVALALGRLGVPTRFVGAVGRDAHGQRLVRGLDEAGVDTSAMHRVAGAYGHHLRAGGALGAAVVSVLP
jgi:fructokinase